MFKKLIILIVSMIFLFSSCMVYHTYSGEAFKSFSKNIRKEQKDIAKIKLEYAMPTIKFKYTMEKDFDKEAEKEIFKKTREFVQSEEFQREFFKYFFKRYTIGKGESIGYPDVCIMLYNKGEEVPLVSYYSEKVGSTYEIENMFIDYDVWKYVDENKETHEVSE